MSWRKKILTISDPDNIPYERFICPRCSSIVCGDLAVIDHYLSHGKIIIVSSIVLRGFLIIEG
ncbi:MAG: hypothetical protein ABDH32_08030 [Candidatus Caldarchaeales archaeon]